MVNDDLKRMRNEAFVVYFKVTTEENRPRFEPGIFCIQVIFLDIDAYCIAELVPPLKRKAILENTLMPKKEIPLNILALYSNILFQLDKSNGIEIGSACSAQVAETKEFSSSFCKTAA